MNIENYENKTLFSCRIVIWALFNWWAKDLGFIYKCPSPPTQMTWHSKGGRSVKKMLWPFYVIFHYWQKITFPPPAKFPRSAPNNFQNFYGEFVCVCMYVSMCVWVSVWVPVKSIHEFLNSFYNVVQSFSTRATF